MWTHERHRGLINSKREDFYKFAVGMISKTKPNIAYQPNRQRGKAEERIKKGRRQDCGRYGMRSKTHKGVSRTLPLWGRDPELGEGEDFGGSARNFGTWIVDHLEWGGGTATTVCLKAEKSRTHSIDPKRRHKYINHTAKNPKFK